MNLKDYPYRHIELSQIQEEFDSLFSRFESAGSFSQIDEIFSEIQRKRSVVMTSVNLASIRYSQNTYDEYFQKEQNYYDEISPDLEKIDHHFGKLIFNSPYVQELSEKYGSQFFTIMRQRDRIFNDSVKTLLTEENKLSTAYADLISKASVKYRGETMTLSQIGYEMESTERETRKEAAESKWFFFRENQSAIGGIYSDLVKIRSEIADKLGYESFTGLGYDRMNRIGYSRDDVDLFRNAVYKNIVPAANRFREKQKAELKTKNLYYYDEPLFYKEGNPKPGEKTAGLLKSAMKMYQELSPETGDFMKKMIDGGFMDLENRDGKMGGGYCEYIPGCEMPFIFSNFNGTSADIDVLTHEFGHAFQVYLTKERMIPEYHFPTSEGAEIFSMSMEMITYPWMKYFFGDQYSQYRRMHLSSNLIFIPYITAVDEFQHSVYDNPEISQEERNRLWRKIEKKYMPYRDYEKNDFLEFGGFWMKQAHIFEVPFYYIDYALAQILSFQLYLKYLNDPSGTWDKYTESAKTGGSGSFNDIIQTAGLKNPFNIENTESVVRNIENLINSEAAEC